LSIYTAEKLMKRRELLEQAKLKELRAIQMSKSLSPTLTLALILILNDHDRRSVWQTQKLQP